MQVRKVIFGKSKVSLSPFRKELDNDFRRIDNSARALFRAISYVTKIAAFLDEAECENENDKLKDAKLLSTVSEVWLI